MKLHLEKILETEYILGGMKRITSPEKKKKKKQEPLKPIYVMFHEQDLNQIF